MTDDIKSKQPFLIVGIGASAGGLDALQRFLAALPADFDFSLVFIQHLSAKHKSLLQELLSARRPSLVIQQISDGLKIQPGRLYLAPPGREVRLQNSLFQTTVHAEGLIHLPIDEFLNSLAENTGGQSIAVIFSGAGTDGARGCQAIRAAGGTVFVQDPQTAEFDSMPLAAIATGHADAVLSPEDIVAELLKLQGVGEPAVLREHPVAPEEYGDFFRILQEKTGSRFHHYKKSVVSRRIKRRMYLQGLPSVKEYLDLISASDAEAALLASDLMIGVTSFFRDRVAWKALNVEAVRKISAESSNLPIRVWTAASATGEEAYSIAMMLLHELALTGKKRDIHVFATDVNERALERAREGKYPASITADVPQEYVQKYFTPTGDGNFLVINKDVRECVVFAKQDLLTDPPFSKLDLTICRNFLIYLEPEAQEKSITLFHYALKEGGYLFLGNAETVGRKSTLFKSIGHKQCRVYRKLETMPASRLSISVPCATERQPSLAKQTQMTEQNRSLAEIIQEKLLEEYGPASVAIDQNYEIIYHNGPTNRYLQQPRGVPTQNFLELVPVNLRSRVRGALYRSGREERPVVIRTSMDGDDNKKRYVSLRITKAAEHLSIVVFQEKSALSKREAAEQVDATVIEETAIRQLESELSATRADLQSHIEQLKSMNEEFQSSNEELQAANEELETSREELQSLNEELITVNSQLQGKIEEQDVTNNDLNNFLTSTNIPTIFLDTHFRVKRFTPAMLKLIKLIPSDVGRPIVDMSQENLGPDLTSDVQSVLDSLVPARQELELDGAWYVRTTLPYRTADNRIEGVVITYNDVSDLKRAEERTRHLASFPQLNPNPVIEVDASGNVIFVNRGTERILESLSMDTGDITVFLPKDLDTILQDLEKNGASSFSREVMLKDRIFSETIHLVPQFKVARIYAYDITERKRAQEALRQKEEQFRLLVEGVKDYAIFMLDPEGRVKTWNEGAERLKGYKTEEIIGQHFSRFYPVEDAASGKPQHELDAATDEGWFEDEGWRVRKDGSRFWASVLITALRDNAGTLLGFTKVTRDVTERRWAEEALRESEKRYHDLFNTMNEGFCIIEVIFNAEGRPVDYRFLEINAAFEKQTGLHEATGKLMRELAPAHEAHWFEIYGKIALTGEPARFVNEAKALNRYYDVSAYRVGRPEDRHVAILFNDISELKRAEETLRQSEERLRYHVENSPLAVVEWDADFIVTRWAGEAEKILGWSAADSVGKPIMDLRMIFEEDIPIVQKTMEKLTDGVSRHVVSTNRNYTKDGKVIHCTWYNTVLLDAAGKMKSVMSQVLDITERKRAEEAVKASEAKYRSLFDNMINGFAFHQIVVDEAGKPVNYIFREVNSAFEKLTGLKASDILNKNVTQAMPGIEKDPADWIGAYGKVALTGEVLRFEQYAEPLGKWYSVMAYSPMRNYFATVFEDITERKRAEEALKASEEQFRALADSIPNLAWWANGDGYITWYNRRWYEYTGTTPEQMEGWGWQSVHDPEALPKVLERWTVSISTGEPFDMEFPLRGADGIFRTFLTRIIPLKDSAGHVVRWFGTNTDISALKQAEESLRGSEARYRGLFENLIEGFAYCKMIFENGKPQDFIYLSVNHAFETLTGLKNVVGKRVTEVIPGIREADHELFEIYGRVSLTGKPERFETFVEALKMWFSIFVYSPEKEFFVAVFDVITERKKAEADIMKLSEDMSARNLELEFVNKELESFIYSVSHDLRAPIRTMSGFAKVLHEDYVGKLDAKGQDYLNRILKGSERSNQLINDLLHLSNISRQELSRINVNLSKKASKIAEELRETDPRNVEVVVREGLTAFVDPRLIELALSNLLGNAWKFTSKKEKAKIEFGAFECGMRNAEFGMKIQEQCEQGETVYFIRDNGAGFDMSYADKMFWPFHRLHTDREFEGTGIGLTIVERVIRRHGGKVWAEGEVGKGATVFFTL